MRHASDAEMTIAEKWASRFEAGDLPVSFSYGDRPVAELIKSWPVERSSRSLDAQRTEKIVSWREPATGLAVRGEVIAHADFPAVEWVFTLGNASAADTPILADVQPLDICFPVDPEQRCCLHHARGSQFRLEDFEPVETPLMLKIVTELRLASTSGRSSDGALPFINLQKGQVGVMIAIGWTGDWMQRTHFTLQPGEKIRTPRLLLLIWEAQSRGVRGTEGAWGEFPVDTHLAQIRWIQEHNLPAEAYWLDAGWYGDAPHDPNASVWTGTWARQVGSWHPNRGLYIEGLYAFWDKLLARHPGLVIDNCSSGGRRIDLESISRWVTFTRSDLNDWPFDDDHVIAMQTLTHGLSLWYPVSFAGTRGADVCKMRSALGPGIAMGWSYAAIIKHQDMPMDVLCPRLDELASVRRCFYGDYYPLLPFTLSREAWDGWQFDRPDLGSGVFQVFRREFSPSESARFALHGLEAEAQYDVTEADTGSIIQASGRELMDKGLPVRIAERPAAVLLCERRTVE
jgi:Glycosyl hydrolase family 36 C-terminal domain